jgi:hypothetical protein
MSSDIAFFQPRIVADPDGPGVSEGVPEHGVVNISLDEDPRAPRCSSGRRNDSTKAPSAVRSV